MIRFLLAGLTGALLYAVWAVLSQSGMLPSGPATATGELLTVVLAALAGQAIGARNQRGPRESAQADAANAGVPSANTHRSPRDESQGTAPAPPAPPATLPPARIAQPVRSEAITLLASLQREARFIDLVQEPLTDYSDAQVGAAARDVLRDCRAVLDRYFALRPVVDQPEGTPVEVPADQAEGRYRLAGADPAESPGRAALVHHGWEAQQCQLPQWTGAKELALVVAPAELEKR